MAATKQLLFSSVFFFLSFFFTTSLLGINCIARWTPAQLYLEMRRVYRLSRSRKSQRIGLEISFAGVDNRRRHDDVA